MIDFKRFDFKKGFGQNFIFDKSLLSQIVSDSGITEEDNILEIGAGAGTLTANLAKKAKKVVSYEIDKTLKEHLMSLQNNFSNLTIYIKDALKTNITEIEEDFVNENYCVVANLPYYITSPLIFKFIEESNKVKNLTVMVQKEVAERFCSLPNSRDYGISTVMLNYHADVEYLRTIDRSYFNPAPKVDSALIKITPNKNKAKANDEQKFKTLVQSAFSMRRKTLINNLTKHFDIDKEILSNLLSQISKSQSVRAEELSIQDFIFLSNNL